MLSQPKRRSIAIALAIASAVSPITGLHKFYLGQPLWGVVYLLIGWTPIPKIASIMEAVWYALQRPEEFNQYFNAETPVATMLSVSPSVSEAVAATAEALRQLEALRQEGLISEYEFEYKRRQILHPLP
jgi:TM2 domain-containing membrane protein YozV